MKKIKITLEMGDEVVTLSLNTNSSLEEVLGHITKIRTEETIESLIEKQLSFELPDGDIYESPDGGRTIYKRKLGHSKKELINRNRFKMETRYDMGGSYEVKERDLTPTMSEWYCSYCGDHTYEVDSDYLSGVDHLSCVIRNEREKKEKG